MQRHRDAEKQFLQLQDATDQSRPVPLGRLDPGFRNAGMNRIGEMRLNVRGRSPLCRSLSSIRSVRRNF